jgi:hypothetical protein
MPQQTDRRCPDCDIAMDPVQLQTPEGFGLRVDAGDRPTVAPVGVACPACGLLRLYLPDSNPAHEDRGGMEV